MLLEGETTPEDVEEIAKVLTSIDDEPLQILHRAGLQMEQKLDLAGLKVEVGANCTDAPALAHSPQSLQVVQDPRTHRAELRERRRQSLA